MAEAVIFDMDGVLVDSEGISVQGTIAAIEEMYGYTLQPEDFTAFIGTGARNYVAGALAKYGVKLDDLNPLLERRLQIIRDMLSDVTVFPGVIDFIERLKGSDFILAIASSSPHDKVVTTLANAHINTELFSTITDGDQVERLKPHPDIYLKTLETLDIDAHKCIVIEDSIAGIQSAKSAGMVCIGITNSFNDEQLMEAGADLIITSMEDLTVADMLIL